MAKYKLLAEHVTSDGMVLPAGTEVGDGTPYPWPMDPSNQMEGVDDDGKARVEAYWQERYGHGPDTTPEAIAKAREEEAAASAKREEEIKAGPPVSDAQKEEREAEKPPEPPPAQARGGVQSPSPGPATVEPRRVPKPNVE